MDFFIFGRTEIPGWFYSREWNYYQKTSGNVVCYISKHFGGDGHYKLQLYRRGKLVICDLEYRSFELEEVMDLADKWLEAFKDAEIETLHAEFYSPHNAKGYWQTDYKMTKMKAGQK